MGKGTPKTAIVGTSGENSPGGSALARIETEQTETSACVKLSETEAGFRASLQFSDRDASSDLRLEAFGTTDPNFESGFLLQLIDAAPDSVEKCRAQILDFYVAVMRNIKPRDPLEAMLAGQMAAVHRAAMSFSGRLAAADDIRQLDSAQNALNKLARTFASQMDTLKRYRSNAEQKITMQQVTVNDGGQAIVGDVSHEKQHWRDDPDD